MLYCTLTVAVRLRAILVALALLTAVNHQKARAIFLDPGEGDARALEELRAAFMRDPVPGVTLPACQHTLIKETYWNATLKSGLLICWSLCSTLHVFIITDASISSHIAS